MLFAITLGAILGGAGATLLHQWAASALEAGERAPVLTPAAFPRLAAPSPRHAPRFAPRYAPRFAARSRWPAA